MYQIESSSQILQSGRRLWGGPSRPPSERERALPRPDEPVHRHLVRDGHDGPPALCAREPEPHADGVRRGGRAVSRRRGDRPPGRRFPGGPDPPLQERRGRRIYALDGVPRRTAGVRKCLGVAARGRAHRPARQGHSQRFPRRHDLVQHAPQRAGHGLRRSSGAGHRRCDDRTTDRVRDPDAGTGRLRRGVRGQPVRRADRSCHPGLVRREPAGAGRRPTRTCRHHDRGGGPAGAAAPRSGRSSSPAGLSVSRR